MTKIARRKTYDIGNRPVVSLRVAAVIMNMGIKKFKVYWNNELRHRVHWVKTARGDRVVLEDIMREAFPDIENQIGLMCIDVLYRQAELRKRTQLNVLREAL